MANNEYLSHESDEPTRAEVQAFIDNYRGVPDSSVQQVTNILPSSEIDIRIRAKGDGVTLVSQALGQLGAGSRIQPSAQLQLYPYYSPDTQQLTERPQYGSAYDSDRPIPMEFDELSDAPTGNTDDEYDGLYLPSEKPKSIAGRNVQERVIVERRASKRVVALVALAALAATGAGAWNASQSGPEAVKACKVDFMCYPGQFIDSFTFGLINPQGDRK